jgi:FHS family L-fucose permease-like MFS transporter
MPFTTQVAVESEQNWPAGVPLTERKYIAPLVLVTTLFFLWAIGVNLNDILIPHFKRAFGLTDFRSSLIQTAFFGGYFLAALPAGWFMERVGYKRGILAGLLICALGALLFIPAASIRAYELFLLGLFVMACGQSFLEVAANPYVTILGPPESAERRLNLAQSFNAVGALTTPILGSFFILSHVPTVPSGATLSGAQLEAFRVAEARAVELPYLGIALIFLAVAVLVSFSPLPETPVARDLSRQLDSGRTQFWRILRFPHFIVGVGALFFYVGAQVGAASFVIRLVEHVKVGTSDVAAANYLKLHLLGFMIGRFSGSLLMKRISASSLLAAFAVASLLCISLVLLAGGGLAGYGVAGLGFFHSIMFPTIFALSLKGLGSYTKVGSSILVMAIIGGAICPAIMGYISDHSNIQRAFVVPLLCQVVVLWFALSSDRLARRRLVGEQVIASQ